MTSKRSPDETTIAKFVEQAMSKGMRMIPKMPVVGLDPRMGTGFRKSMPSGSTRGIMRQRKVSDAKLPCLGDMFGAGSAGRMAG